MADALTPTDHESRLAEMTGSGRLAANLHRHDSDAVAWALAEIGRLRAEVGRLTPPRTLAICDRCGRGEPPRATVDGLCPGCARGELARLRAESERLQEYEWMYKELCK